MVNLIGLMDLTAVNVVNAVERTQKAGATILGSEVTNTNNPGEVSW